MSSICLSVVIPFFQQQGDFNVILVDWEKGAGITRRWPLAYTQPVQNTRVVGKQIAMLISNLQATTSVNPANIHLIGASLGAQVAGYAGMYLNGTVGRITGKKCLCVSIRFSDYQTL